ncbi:hypothetical protein M3Y94_00706200 [Aphelenchoides besseyi]|nr:hypothetical protein M3Y94_00706200 [Aphelenchoides besseyi]KAI6231664.1 hypothetical protein M3Y95_00405700 [Aphelenchoides besseyi]
MRSCIAVTVLAAVFVCLASPAGHQTRHKSAHPPVHHNQVHHPPVHHNQAHHPAHKTAEHHPAHKTAHKTAHKPAKHHPAHKPEHHPTHNTHQGSAHKSEHQQGPLRHLRMAPDDHRVRAIRAGTVCGNWALNCRVVDNMCGEKEFASILKTYCRMSCGFCPPPQNKCKDKVASQCKKWVGEGFCKSAFLSKQMVRSLCAKSCSMCGGETDCSLGPNLFLSECLKKTCAMKKYHKHEECREYCKRHPSVCGEQPQQQQCSKANMKYTDKCLPTTCALDAEKTTAQCVQWCKENPGEKACSKSSTKCTDATKYNPECLSETCAKDEEKKKPSKECEQFCKDKPTDPACTATPTADQCEVPATELTTPCLHHSCRKAEKKTVKECKDYCDKTLTDPSCVEVEPNANPTCDTTAAEFTDPCYSTTCRRATKRDDANCKKHCDADPSKPECAMVQPGDELKCLAGETNEHDAACLIKSCRLNTNRQDQSCKDVCDDATKTASAMCNLVEPNVNAACEADPDPYKKDNCAAYLCRKSTNKGNVAECVNWCAKPENAKTASCIGVEPPATPSTCNTDSTRYGPTCVVDTCRSPTYRGEQKCKEYCEDKPTDLNCLGVDPTDNYQDCLNNAARKDLDECMPVTCRYQAQKTTNTACQKWCDQKANDPAHPECFDVTPGPNPSCDTAATEFNAECIQRTCRKKDKKSEQKCKEYCQSSDDAKKPECRGVEPVDDAQCNPDDKKYTSSCLEYTCRFEKNKGTKECEDWCKNNAQSAACIY